MPRKKQQANISLNDYLHILTSAALEYEENGGAVTFTAQADGVNIFLPLVAYDDEKQALFVSVGDTGQKEGENNEQNKKTEQIPKAAENHYPKE